MKIAFFQELPFGGARRVVLEHLRYLGKNHDVDLFYTTEQQDFELESMTLNSFWYPFEAKEWTGNDWKTRLSKDSWELLKLAWHHRKIAQQIDASDYDVIIVHPSLHTQAPFILSFLSTKSIYYCHEPLRLVYDEALAMDDSFTGPKMIYERLNRYLRKIIDRLNVYRADLLVTNCPYAQEQIKKAYNLTSKFVYPGVNFEIFHPVKVKKSFDIGFIGVLDQVEGYDLLEEALKKIDGNLKVNFVSRNLEGKGVSDEELVHQLCSCKLIVCLSRNEPFGLIPLESGACGLPVIAVREGGYCETVIDGKTGYLIARDSDILIEKINKILSNAKLQKMLGKNAKKHVFKNWGWDKGAKKLEEILKKL